jgi:hypothetical protein
MTPARQRVLTIGLITLGILIAGFFGLRSFRAFREFRRHGPPPPLAEALTAQPVETDVELIRDWMTVPYISMTYHVHPKALFDAVGINPRGNDEKSLEQLNEEFFPDKPGIVIELIKAAVQANQPPPTAVNPDVPPSPPSASP